MNLLSDNIVAMADSPLAFIVLPLFQVAAAAGGFAVEAWLVKGVPYL